MDFEKEWKEIALRRLQELRSKKCNAVPGDEVFKRLFEKYKQFHPAGWVKRSETRQLP